MSISLRRAAAYVLRDQRRPSPRRASPSRSARYAARSAKAIFFASATQMQIVGGVVAERRDVEAFEDVQHLERDEALRARRHLEQVVAAIVVVEIGCDPVGACARRSRVRRAGRRARACRRDRARDRPGVERVAAASRNQLEASPRAAGWRRSRRGAARGRPGRNVRAAAGSCASRSADSLPVVRDDLLHREAVARVADRRLQRLRRARSCRSG